jgi:MFS family permease
MGLLPSYASISIASPNLLVVLRFVQGVALACVTVTLRAVTVTRYNSPLSRGGCNGAKERRPSAVAAMGAEAA